MTLPALYQALADYNLRINERVYAVCAEMTDEARKRDRGAFFGSIHGTLNHVLHGDRAWLNRLADGSIALPANGVDLYESFEDLHVARAETDADITALTATLTDVWLASELTWSSRHDRVERVQPRWLLVSHMFNHQTHHRGQLTTLLTQAGHDVGVTDLPRLVT